MNLFNKILQELLECAVFICDNPQQFEQIWLYRRCLKSQVRYLHIILLSRFRANFCKEVEEQLIDNQMSSYFCNIVFCMAQNISNMILTSQIHQK